MNGSPPRKPDFPHRVGIARNLVQISPDFFQFEVDQSIVGRRTLDIASLAG